MDDRAARRAATRKVGRHSRSTTGLLNPGNNCFANSSLQSLAASPHLYKYLCGLQQYANTSASPVFSLALLELCTALNQPLPPGARKSLSPEPIIGVLEHVYRARLSRRQNDAHEMLHLLLETLEIEWSRLAKLNPEAPFPKLPFQGTVVDTIRCSICKTESSRGETAFLVQSLLVPVSSARQCYVEDLLTHAVQGVHERIDGYNCTKCRLGAALAPPEIQRASGIRPTTSDVRQCLQPYENRPQQLPAMLESLLPTVPGGAAEKLTILGRAPPLLILHLSRSVYGAFGARRNACRVMYPDFLSVRAYAETSDNSGADKKPFERTVRYRLHAVIRHAGTHASGHYEASRRSSSFWETNPDIPGTMPPFWTISDASVAPATLSQTLDAGSNAYILLYEAID